MFRKYYPPVRYVFYPLYRWVRRRKLPIAVAYLSVWIVSGLLHGALFLGFGHPVGAGGMLLLFTCLGLAGIAAIAAKHRSRRRN